MSKPAILSYTQERLADPSCACVVRCSGPEAYVPAALSFYRALRIYPAPAELIGSKSYHRQASCCRQIETLTHNFLSPSPSYSSLRSSPVLSPYPSHSTTQNPLTDFKRAVFSNAFSLSLEIQEKTVLPPVFEIVKELIALSNAIAQTTAQATAGVSAAAPAELGIDGEDDEEEQMMKALQAAIAGAGQA